MSSSAGSSSTSDSPRRASWISPIATPLARITPGKAPLLSGGERLRLALCLELTRATPPQLLLLDEPSNHLDLDALGHLEAVLRAYRGALVVVSHDETFLERVGVERRLALG